jgi:hypothetical protein
MTRTDIEMEKMGYKLPEITWGSRDKIIENIKALGMNVREFSKTICLLTPSKRSEEATHRWVYSNLKRQKPGNAFLISVCFLLLCINRREQIQKQLLPVAAAFPDGGERFKNYQDELRDLNEKLAYVGKRPNGIGHSG